MKLGPFARIWIRIQNVLGTNYEGCYLSFKHSSVEYKLIIMEIGTPFVVS
jgi:hypothetical protein